AGATELDLLLDYANDEANSAYTEIILKNVQEAADANGIDKDGDGQLSIDEIEQAFLDAQFAAEDELEDGQKPEFNRFLGATPVAVSDTFTAPPGISTKVNVSESDNVAFGMGFVRVAPPDLRSDLFTWNPKTGEAIVTGLSTIGQVTFTYKFTGSGWETDPVTVTIKVDPRMNYLEEF